MQQSPERLSERRTSDTSLNPIASLYLQKNTIGCTLFDPSQKCIKIQLIRQQVGLTCVLSQYLSKYSVNTLLINQKLKKELQGIDSLRMIVVNSKDYQSESIESSLLLFDSKDQRADKKSLLRMVIDWSEMQIVKALGALTYHLMQERLIDRSFKLDDIIPGCFRQTVSIPKHTYQYLDIIKEQMHPCMSVQGRSKEGFTILNIYLTFTITDLGRKRMIDLFYNPTYRRDVLEDRYNTIGFIHKRLSTHQKSLNKCLRKIHNIQAILTEFDKIKNKDEDWRKLRNSLESMLILQRIIMSVSIDTQNKPTLIQKIENLNMQTIGSLLHMIDSTLQLNPLQIKSNVFDTLDKLRNSYDDMQHLLTLYARSQDWQFEFRIKYMSQIGYMVIIPSDLSPPDNWQLQFSNSSGQFYTNELTEMLDQRFGDIYGEIMDIEESVLIDLESHIRNGHEEIMKVYNLVGEFDCWLAVAKVSKSLSRPQLTENKLVVVNGWHMLLGERSINNNAFSLPFETKHQIIKHNSEQNLVNSNYSNRCCILSGPNGSGKTLYLKQTGIIVFLAHIGSYVPAQLASIPLIDRLASHHFVRSLYLDRFGIEQQAFQLNRVLRTLTNRSLLMIDELGHTTSHVNAIELMHTTVRYLTQRQFPNNQEFDYSPIQQLSNQRVVGLPITFIITHLYELFNNHLVNLSYSVRFLNAIIYREHQGRTLTFLYKIKPGLYRDSVAIESCQSLGLEQDFINYSREFHDLIKSGRAIIPQSNLVDWKKSTQQMIASLKI